MMGDSSGSSSAKHQLINNTREALQLPWRKSLGADAGRMMDAMMAA